MKTFRLLTVLCSVLLLALASPPPVQAQGTFKTNDLPLFATTVTAGANSNMFGLGASYPSSLGGGILLPNSDQGISVTVKYSCPTSTIIQSVFWLQLSPDSNAVTWPNIPGASLLAVVVPGQASPTNVVYTTNFTKAQIGNYKQIRLGGTTNGSAADNTLSRITAGYWY